MINASPDIRFQMESFPALQPCRTLRDTGIASILLVDSQIDHTTGLLSLRENDSLNIYCTKEVHNDLTHNFNIFSTLKKYCDLNIQTIEPGKPFTISGFEDTLFHAIDVESKAPPYSPNRESAQSGTNIGLMIQNKETLQKLFYAPGLGAVHPQTFQAMQDSDCVLVDGTFWQENDMELAGVGTKLAQEMGHLPLSGKGGMIKILQKLPKARKVLIHINNTNPILDENSEEYRLLSQGGIEVAYDGMEINL